MTATTLTTTSATKTLNAAIKATAAAANAIGPAEHNLQAAQQTLTEANEEALHAVTVKNPDPQAARDRITKSRKAIKEAEDAVQWAVLELHAAQAVHQNAHEDEQAARRRVFVDEYLAEITRWNNGPTHEQQLLEQLQAAVTAATIALVKTQALHNRLAGGWASLPPDERPPLPTGPFQQESVWLRGEYIDALHPDVAAALKRGTAAAGSVLHQLG